MQVEELTRGFGRMIYNLNHLDTVIEAAVNEGYENIKVEYKNQFKNPTGKTEAAIEKEIKAQKGRIFIRNERAYIARFHETGTAKMQPGKWIFKNERDRIKRELPGICVRYAIAGFHSG